MARSLNDRLARLEASLGDRRPVVRVVWREDDTDVEDDEDAEVIRLDWERPS
jgi:hypothetical protein